MSKFKLSFIVILLLQFYSTCSASTSFDELALAQSWPQTTCWNLNKRWDQTTCSPCSRVVNKSNRWTLHGLWPNSNHGDHPSFCKRTNPELSSALKAELKVGWPTFKDDMNNQVFWNYEYKKHGSCALTLDKTNTAEKYFKTALQLLEQYNAKDILENAGINPGSKYSLEDIYNAFTNQLGVGVYVACAYSTTTNEPHLTEVRICFDKSFNLIDCSGSKMSNCRYNVDINYPVKQENCAY